MILSTLFDYDLIFYRRHLYEIAEKTGVETVCFVLDSWEMEITRSYRKYKRLLKLSREYGKKRFEKAAERANFYNRKNPDILTYILRKKLDELPLNKNSDISGQSLINFE